MGIFGTSILEDNSESEDKINRNDISELVALIINNTFLSEAYLATYPITTPYVILDNELDNPYGLDLEDDEDFSKWIKNSVFANDWSSVKREFRNAVEGASSTCIELPSNIIKSLSNGVDTQIAAKMCPPASQLNIGKQHIAKHINTPYFDNAVPFITQIQSKQRLLKQEYDKFHKEYTSIWNTVKNVVFGGAAGVLMASSGVGLLLGGAKLAHMMSADAPGYKYIEQFDNYIDLIDEYRSFDRESYDQATDELLALAANQAIPLVEKYIDLLLQHELTNLEHIYAVLLDLHERTLKFYKDSPAYVLYERDDADEDITDNYVPEPNSDGRVSCRSSSCHRDMPLREAQMLSGYCSTCSEKLGV